MQLIVNIIVLAAIYALIACGYVLIYRVSRVLNLAHGELMMLGALAGTEMALALANVPHKKGGVQAAMDYLVSAGANASRAAAE